MPPVRTMSTASSSSSTTTTTTAMAAAGPSSASSVRLSSGAVGGAGGHGAPRAGSSRSPAQSPSSSTPATARSASIPNGLLAPMPAEAEGTSKPAPGELKPQKACVACRKSKVKCIHDGEPPCRRCADSGQECKFRLRADDERWRERTDETLSRLSQAVETLITRGTGGAGAGGAGTGAHAGAAYDAYAATSSSMPTPSLTAHTVPLRQSATFPAMSGSDAGPSAPLPPFASSRSLGHIERGYPPGAPSPSGSNYPTSPAAATLAKPMAGPSTPSDRSGSHPHFGRSPGPFAFGPLQMLPPSSTLADAAREGDDARMSDAASGSYSQGQGQGSASVRRSMGPPPHHGMPTPPASYGRSSSYATASGSLSIAMLPPPIPSAHGTNIAHGGHGGHSGLPLPPGLGTGTPYPQTHRLSATSSSVPMPPALIPGLKTLSTYSPSSSSTPSAAPTSSAGMGASSTSILPPQVSAPAPVPIAPDQTLPSSLLLQVGAEAAALVAASAGGSTRSVLGGTYDGGGGAGGGLSGPSAGPYSSGPSYGLDGGGRVRWHVGPPSPYASPSLHLGRDDPRFNAIKLDMIPMENARALFVFFSEWLQPHSFGFPTYAASEQMTPLIISCILTVASLLDPTAQTAPYYATLREDALNLIGVDQPIDGPDMPFNPELGIGVEEITGAAILCAWLGGEVALKVARICRFWAIGYLRHFELPNRNLTVGEMVTALPPFRQIDLCDKLRIWLTAYVAEAQQSFLFDRTPLAPDMAPGPYCQALRAAFRNTDPAFAVPPADRQLIAHAGILAILLDARAVQRERRWEREAKAQLEARYEQAMQEYHQRYAHLQQQQQHQSQHQRNGHGYGHGQAGSSSEESGASVTSNTPGPGQHNQGSQGPWSSGSLPPPPSPPTVAEEVAQGLRCLVSFGREWIEDVERWMVAARKLEDLSSYTNVSLDITLLYHLARAWLGSSALEASRVLSSMSSHGHRAEDARTVVAGLDSLFDVVEHQVIRAAKDGAMRALQLATSRPDGFGDRLAYLPSVYHYLLSHAASFALLLVARHQRWRYFIVGGGEAAELLACVEAFVQRYVFAIQDHGVNNEDQAGVRHPSRTTCQALLRALQQAKASL